MKRLVRRVLALFGRPVVRYFDRWFISVRDDLEATTRHAAAEATRGADIGGALLHELHRVGDDLRIDAETILELTATVSMAADRSREAAETVEKIVSGDGITRTRPGDALASLDQRGADLVNWVISPIGMAGQARVWLNHGANVSFAKGRAWVENLNERVIELPWSHAAAHRLPAGSTVLDVGATESLFSIELATMGHHVFALDPRAYPLSHANLEAVATTVEGWEGPPRPLDAVFAISAIEHFGVGHYVEAADRDDLDRVAMERFATWLAPGAPLFLTVPFGEWSVDELQRVYDSAHLGELLKGWETRERSVFARRSSVEWERLSEAKIDEPWAHPEAGVVLLELVHPID